jgi:predicted transcriptional regulator
MTNKSRTSSREDVLNMIRATPNITATAIQIEVGISRRQTFKVLSSLTDEGLISWTIMPPEPGVSRCPRRGYFIARRHDVKIPAVWDVLAYFFGRIAAEPIVA